MRNVNLSNENIDIFPISAVRPDPAARVLNEINITGMIRGLTDFESYVISKENDDIEFFIHGYHCRANIKDVLSAAGDATSIYAILRINTLNTPVISSDTNNVTNSDPFLGVVFNSGGKNDLSIVNLWASIKPIPLWKVLASPIKINIFFARVIAV